MLSISELIKQTCNIYINIDSQHEIFIVGNIDILREIFIVATCLDICGDWCWFNAIAYFPFTIGGKQKVHFNTKNLTALAWNA